MLAVPAAGVDDAVRRRHVEEGPALHGRALKRGLKRGLQDAVGVLDDLLGDAGSDEAERGRRRQLELGERLRDRVEVAVRRRWAAEEERQDVVVGDVLRAAGVDLGDPLSEDDGAMRDRCHPHDRGRHVWIGGVGDVRPDPRFDVQPGARAGLADLLHVGEPEHVDVVHRQAPVGDRAVDRREHERLVGHVELEEAVLARRVVGSPDGVEPMSFPGAFQPGECPEGIGRPERANRRCGQASGVSRPAKAKSESVCVTAVTVTPSSAPLRPLLVLPPVRARWLVAWPAP